MRRANLLVMSAVALSVTTMAFGQRQSLKVGDAAPGLDIQKWVKGEETAIETGNVYVVEFWATWCVPCRKSIPHLTGLQKEYGDKGLTIIGVSTEEEDVVEPFVQTQGDKMDYTIAVDRRKGTDRAWFRAAGLKGIPAAFVVDRKGKIAFIGNPLGDQEEMDRVISKVIEGRYDPELEEQAVPMLANARNARRVRNWRMAEQAYLDVIALDPQVFADTALELFEMKLVDMNEQMAAYAYAQMVAGGAFASDAGALQMFATKIASDPAIPADDRDMDLALTMAENALSLQGENDPESLSILAMVHYKRNEIDQAIEYQKKAYFLARTKNKADYKRVLNQYHAAQDRAMIK